MNGTTLQEIPADLSDYRQFGSAAASGSTRAKREDQYPGTEDKGHVRAGSVTV
jgi:hypothetical protein